MHEMQVIAFALYISHLGTTPPEPHAVRVCIIHAFISETLLVCTSIVKMHLFPKLYLRFKPLKHGPAYCHNFMYI